MVSEINIFWFRRDLRLDDNVGLFNALSGNNVLPIFIFDEFILSTLDANDARVSFIGQQLNFLQKKLNTINKSLAVFKGKPIDIFKKLCAENHIAKVFTNKDYEPYARKRDEEVKNFLASKNISFNTFKDQVIFQPEEILKENGSPYLIYTPYSKKWKENLKNEILKTYDSENFLDKIISHNYPFLNVKDIGFNTTHIDIEHYDVGASLIQNYAHHRDVPAIKGTSKLGLYLRFGTVSIRKIVVNVLTFKGDVFLNELIWREFFMQILWHFPYTVERSFKPQYDNIIWKNDVVLFEKWCAGKTGYPLVDAGMRQLLATGFMHNRVRMITASFLSKHLLIDWRWGETFFAKHLLDYELSSNVGNWQWVAGCGVDAAPYFRIFNPIEQQKKFDPQLIYVKKWIPEFETKDYPTPVVDHQVARARCLDVFKNALKKI